MTLGKPSLHPVLPAMLMVFTGIIFLNAHGEGVGDYVGPCSVDGNMISIPCSGEQEVRVKMCTPGMVRVDFDPTGQFDPVEPLRTIDAFWNHYERNDNVPNDLLCAGFNTKEWPAVPHTLEDAGDRIILETELLRIDMQKTPVRFSYYRKDAGELLTRNAGDSAMGTYGLRLERSTDEHFFGWSHENHCLNGARTYKYETTDWNEAFLDKTGRICEGATAPILYSTAGYAVFMLNDPERFKPGGVCDISNPGYYHISSNIYRWNNEPNRGYLSYYFIYGPSYRELLDRYTHLTGRPRVVNKKYFGIQKMWWNTRFAGWDGAGAPDVYIDWINKHRENGFHFDIAILFNPPDLGAAGTPDPDAQVPGYTRVLNHCRENNILFSADADGFGVASFGSDGNRTRIETDQEIATAVDHGFDLVWYDAMNTLTQTHSQVMYDAWAKVHEEDRSKVVIRYGWDSFVGHAFPYGHTGDFLHPTMSQSSGGCWRVFPGYLEKSLNAYNVHGTDLGSGAWNVIGTCLRPMISFHKEGNAGCSGGGSSWGGGDNFKQIIHPYNASVEYQTLVRKFHNLHYRFIPYLFTYVSKASLNGFPPWRHMLMHDFENPETWDREFQSYVGEWLIQAPYYPDGPDCREGGIRDNIWLPEGTWYDWWDGTAYRGPKTIDGYNANPGGAAEMRLPLFVKAGAVIPLGPAMSYIGEKPEDPLTLAIWPDNNTEFELWEDETGVKSTFTCRATETQASIGIPPFGGSRYSPADRRYMLEVHVPRKPKKVVRNGVDELGEVSSREALNNEPEGWFFETGRGGVCHVKPGMDGSEGGNLIVSYDGTVQGIQENNRAVIMHHTVTHARAEGLLRVHAQRGWEGRISVTDMKGRIIATQRITKHGTRTIQVPHQRNGIYLITLTSNRDQAVLKQICLE